MSTADVVRGNNKPGPELGGIVDSASPEHRRWLKPLRDAYFASKLTTEEISEKSRSASGVKRLSSKGKVSELLRGAEEYPRWYRVLALYEVLSPSEPSLEQLIILWRTGALAAGRKANWINQCLDEVRREAAAGNIRKAGSTTTRRPVATPRAGQVVRIRDPKTSMVISMIIAIVVGIGLNMVLGNDSTRSPGTGICAPNSVCGHSNSRCIRPECMGRYPEPPASEYPEYPLTRPLRAYINVRPPTDTRNMLRVVLSKDFPVSSFSSAAAGYHYWVRAHDVLFLSCRVGSNLVVAGTGYYVHEGWLMAYEGVSEEDLSALPVCGTQGTSASTPPKE
ncbi:hypothetical protein ACFWSP_35450 [Streptomyces sp. NPDC058618]|uniref:hypothetical protein n=1 Tax=Streptomyces sp. NPDC058618 TaxID=3346558 RepID=UPI0036654FEA